MLQKIAVPLEVQGGPSEKERRGRNRDKGRNTLKKEGERQLMIEGGDR